MITIPEAAEEIVKRSPYLEEALSKGLINLSALARQIQPEIEEKLFKDVHSGAIIMALKRLETKLSEQNKSSQPILLNLDDLSVRSNLTEFTFANSPTLPAAHEGLIQKLSGQRGTFFTFTEGVFETTLIAGASSTPLVEKTFRGERVISKIEKLSAITLILPKENVEVPGLYYRILKALAWQGINVIEIVSSFTELTIILDDSQVEKAFSALKNLS